MTHMQAINMLIKCHKILSTHAGQKLTGRNRKKCKLKIKCVLLAEAQHRRLHSAFEKPFFTFVEEKKQNKEQKQKEQLQQQHKTYLVSTFLSESAGEDQCHRSAYNRRLRATQSPKYSQRLRYVVSIHHRVKNTPRYCYILLNLVGCL